MKRRLIVALVAVIAGLIVVAQPAAARSRIVGGGDADQPYPFVVSLHSASGKFFCAASLIAPTWLVTAAHCGQGKNPAVLSARVDSNDNTQGGEAAQPAEIIVHPDYDPDGGAGGDIALIRLTAPVKAAPITIGAVTAPGTVTRLLGWGQTCAAQGCGKSPTVLQQLDTQIVDGTRCAAAFDGKLELCTDSPNGKAGSCYGDSGGPQIAKVDEKWQLLGVTSRPGTEDVTCATGPSIYTSAPAYAAWITAKITPPPPSAPPPAPAPAA